MCSIIIYYYITLFDTYIRKKKNKNKVFQYLPNKNSTYYINNIAGLIYSKLWVLIANLCH